MNNRVDYKTQRITANYDKYNAEIDGELQECADKFMCLKQYHPKLSMCILP